MAKCIRCGKTCTSGENMCDECKVWFQEKTGGAAASSIKEADLIKKEMKKPINDDNELEKISGKRLDSEIAIQPTSQKKSMVYSRKFLYITLGGVIIVIIVAIFVVMFGAKDKKNEVEDYHAETTDNVYQEANSDRNEANTVNNDVKSPEDSIPENVEIIQKKYQEQIDGYYNNDNIESFSTENGYIYYRYDELIEIDYEIAEDWSRNYYFDNGEVYYILSKNGAGEEDQLFYSGDSLIYWIDSSGNHHNAEEAEEYWGYTVEEAESLYNTYVDKSVVASEKASEYILPNSDREYISKSDLYGLSEAEVRIARNEIMARHGRRFNDQMLQEYFDNCSWYYGTMSPEEFDRNYESNLNEYEKENVTIIKEYEKEQGYNQQ